WPNWLNTAVIKVDIVECTYPALHGIDEHRQIKVAVPKVVGDTPTVFWLPALSDDRTVVVSVKCSILIQVTETCESRLKSRRELFTFLVDPIKDKVIIDCDGLSDKPPIADIVVFSTISVCILPVKAHDLILVM